MKTINKIRILWIDDREEMDGIPEAHLPDGFDEWFEIVHHSSSEEAMSYRSAKEFAPVLQKFWFDKNYDILPVEIIATDYNLLYCGGLARSEKSTEEMAKIFRPDGNNVATSTSDVITGTTSGTNFEGLLISLFYGTLTYKHPSAIVPMTRYLSDMPPEVDTLHSLTEPFLGVDFKYIGLKDRTWFNIIQEGVKHLRRRIQELYKSGDIIVSPHDLMALVESAEHGVVTIHSPFAIRRLPVQGLFIDYQESERNAKIQKWSRNLLGLVVNCEEFKQAIELSDCIWAAYDYGGEGEKNDMVEQRKKLSFMLSEKMKGRSICKDELAQLTTIFEVSGKECKSFTDIRSGNKSGSVQRWAVLLILFKLLRRLVLIKKRVLEQFDLGDPKLTKEDVFLVLFPLPKNPLILPIHNLSDRNKYNNWEKCLSRVEPKMNISDVLDGKGWSPEGPHGLLQSERLILRGLALDDKKLVGRSMKLKKSPYFHYETARFVLFGEDTEVNE